MLKPHDSGTAETLERRLIAQHGTELIRSIAQELAQMRDDVQDLAEAIEELRTAQSFGGLIRAIALTTGGPPLPRSMTIEAQDDLSLEDGFYLPERDRDGQAFRWTGPTRHFSFVICVDRSEPLRICLEALGLVDPARQDAVRLIADGVVLPFSVRLYGGRYQGNAVLPPGLPHERTRLTFLMPCVLPPEGDGQDQRLLGLSFRRLLIEPVSLPTAPLVAGWQADPAEFPLETARSLYADELIEGHPSYYPLEKDARERPFRWSAVPSISFEFWLDRSQPLLVRLSLVALADRERQAPVWLDVNGIEFLCTLQPADDLIDAVAIVPAAETNGASRFTFSLQTLVAGDDGDTRALGMAFHALHVIPANVTPAGVSPAADSGEWLT